MLDILQATRINSDASDEDLKPGEFRDALNISSIANEIGAFAKGTTYGNIDTNIVFKGLNADAVCLGTAIDSAANRIIITFYQRVPIPFSDEYQGVLDYATSRGFTLPSPPVQAAQNFLMGLLKQDGLLVGLDVLFCFWGDGDVNFAKINWKLPNDATSAVNNGMIYDVNYGFKGTGSAWLDTKWLPSTGVKFQLNNGGVVIGYEEIFQDTTYYDGVIDDTVFKVLVNPYYTVNAINLAINTATIDTVTNVQITTAPGLVFVSRIDNATMAVRKNASDSFTTAEAVNAQRPARSFFLGGRNNNGGFSTGTLNRYSLFAAGEYLNTFNRETKFYNNWLLYKNSFVTPLVTETHVQEVLMYLLVDQYGGVVSPLVKSSLMQVSETSYLDGYAFINDLFYFNFRESAPKGINIRRALDSPGFYDKIAETSLTVIKPHPPYAPVAVRAVGSVPNAPIQKKPFQFMMVYNFVDGEQSTKSPASEYLNSLDDVADTLLSLYDNISITMDFPQKDYSIVDNVELFVRNNNAIADWRSVTIIPRTSFVQAGENYRNVYVFSDNAVGNFLPIELGIKINDTVPQRSNYLAFIENRIFLIDSLLDYTFVNAFQIKVDRDVNSATPDDRIPSGGVGNSPLYGLAELEYDSEYSVGLAFYDKYGRKYPASIKDVKLVTPAFSIVTLPATDSLPLQTTHAQLKKAKITAKYDLRAAGNINNYGKPPSFAFWWGMIRSRNTKWEFQQAIQCLLRFPYSITKWPDTDPAMFPDPNLFLEDGYLYWHVEKLLYGASGSGLTITQTMVNDYIDIVVPPNFPHSIDNEVLIDFMLEVTTSTASGRVHIRDREVIETFSNKIRIRGDRAARWFSNAGGAFGLFRRFPKYVTGVNLDATPVTGVVIRTDEATFPLIIKRRRKNDIENIILYDTPQVYPVTKPGTIFATFQPTQTANVSRVEYPPTFVVSALARTLNQGDIIIQPLLLTPTTAAVNHSIKIQWGVNTGDSLRLKIKASIWQLNDLNQPIIELYSATSDAGGPYKVQNGTLVEYPITDEAEFTGGWYGYGVEILESAASGIQFENPDFNINTNPVAVDGWQQSPEGSSALLWRQDGVDLENFAYVNVSALGSGFSKTLYQYLEADKDEFNIEVVVESVGITGPLTAGAITQYPGNTETPAANNADEQLLDLNRTVTPYYIDCDTPPRIAVLDTLTYTLDTAAPPGATIRAEIWRLNQTTKQPTTKIAGSEGTVTAMPTAPGTYSVPFGSVKSFDTSGWYGLALLIDLPTFADFTDKNYASGASAWTVKAGSPTWAYSPDTSAPDVYGDITATPPVGAALGYLPMNTALRVAQPIFLPTGTDVAGYSNHRLIIDWGDNVANGWSTKSIVVAIWEVNQTTKKPTSTTPLMSATISIGTGGTTEYFISNASMLLGNKWYAFGLHSPSGHAAPVGTQFSNPTFPTNLSDWTITTTTNCTWTRVATNGGAARIAGSAGGFDSGIFYQGLSGYAQVTLPRITRGANVYSQFIVRFYLNGVLKQTIDLTSHFASNDYASVVFDPVYVGGGTAGIKFEGAATGFYASEISAVFNSFNAYLFGSPRLRKAVLSGADNENWISWISPNSPNYAPVDYARLSALTYWKVSNEGKSGSAFAGIGEGVVGSFSAAVYADFSIAANESTGIVYGILDAGDIGTTSFYYTIGVRHAVAAGTIRLQVWVFNDPTNIYATGVTIALLDFTGTSNYNAAGVSVSVPGGYKYIGLRIISQTVGANGTLMVPIFFIWPQSGTYTSWSKNGATYVMTAKERQLISAGGVYLANFHADNIAPSASTAHIGQPSLVGILVRANIDIFSGPATSDYTLFLYDNAGTLLGSTAVTGQALNANPQISVVVVNAPVTTGLFLALRNDNISGNISVRIRQITNVNSPVNIGADSTIANAKTWRIDASNNMTQLSTTSFTEADGTDDVPQPANPVTVVLADAVGVEISVPQTFVANDGPKTLLLSPTLAVLGNFNYGVKVKNNPVNGTLLGTIRIHSVTNVATNAGIANIIGKTINPAAPLYEAWNQFSTGAFVRAGYVTNFIAVADDITVSAFTPVQINPTSYHLVHNVVPAGIPAHSADYAAPTDSPYNYGVVFPSISSDPDAAGIVYEQKTGQSIGDINIKIIDQRQRSQSNIVRWSDPVIAGTKTNNLNSFLDGNKYSVDFQRGAIQVMITMHDHTLFCIHTQGMSSLYVQRSMMISPSEVQGQDDQLFLTNKIIGSDNKLTSNLGTVNPESCRVVESGTIGYGFDLIRKSFWQKTNNGVRNLTYECNAKNFFNDVCFYRIQAYNEGEDVKIYSGYNEKQKSFYLTFAPFIFRGQPYPGVTVAYNAYIDGFLSRYSFEPMSYLATEDIIHTVKARELNNPDFFGDFSQWSTLNPNITHTADWFQSFTNPAGAKSATPVPGSTRIVNPDFVQGATFWSTYGGGSAWIFDGDGASSTIAASGNNSKDLVNISGAPGTYTLRINANLPVTGLTYTVKVYDGSGTSIETLLALTAMTGDEVITVIQTLPGRIGIIIKNNTGSPITVRLNLFSTVVKTFLLYQPMPLAVENLRVRIGLPARLGSIKVLVYAFSNTNDPFMTLLHTTSLIRMKDAYVINANVSNPATAKYVGLYTVTDYDVTTVNYFGINGVPSIWRHDQHGRTNNFYGKQYDTMIDLVFNVQAGQVRIFNSLGINSETAWSVESFMTSEGQFSILPVENFRLRDGIYYGTILRDILTPQAALPDPINSTPLISGSKMAGTSIRMVIRNSETLRQVVLSAVYISSDELSGNLLGKK